jgi:hypothetical protein
MVRNRKLGDRMRRSSPQRMKLEAATTAVPHPFAEAYYCHSQRSVSTLTIDENQTGHLCRAHQEEASTSWSTCLRLRRRTRTGVESPRAKRDRISSDRQQSRSRPIQDLSDRLTRGWGVLNVTSEDAL